MSKKNVADAAAEAAKRVGPTLTEILARLRKITHPDRTMAYFTEPLVHGGALGLAGGAGYYGAEKLMGSEPVKMPPTFSEVALPTISKLGPERRNAEDTEKTSAAGAAAASVGHFGNYLRDVGPLLATPTIALLAGSGIHSALRGREAGNANTTLAKAVAEREALFNKLLEEEQTLAAGLDPKVAMANLVDDLTEGLNKVAATNIPGMPFDFSNIAASASDVAYARSPVGKMIKAISIIAAITGGAFGHHYATKSTPYRIKAQLDDSLDERLIGDKSGPAAPPPIRVTTDRVGLTSLPDVTRKNVGLRSPEKGRDILANL